MAKAGRKRKHNAPRTPSGTISKAGKDPRMTALAQHHRAGRVSEWRGTTMGRLLEDERGLVIGINASVLYDAAGRFAKSYGAYQAAVASRRPMAVTGGSIGAPEDVDATQDAIDRYTRASSVLQRAGHPIRQATHELCCEHHEETWSPPFHLAFHAVEGLRLLAEHYGLEWRA